MKKFFIISLFSIISFASTLGFGGDRAVSLKLGTYMQAGLKVTVSQTIISGEVRPGIFHVVVTEPKFGGEFLNAYVNPFTWQLFKSPLGAEALVAKKRPKVRAFSKPLEFEKAGFLGFWWTYGGFDQKYRESVILTVNENTGEIVGVEHLSEVAPINLGKYSHYFQKTVQRIYCGNLLGVVPRTF
jgi:hypothetical protein